ncbi:unnamed protein product [Arctia plantaginis]|uniref:Uncharacterized protein n=1 Tax=Arctia plantaginis TaxID=874455 RepID=A0A8S1APC0_ARCPL|nr:unnamed protein product [Arctia plantaginis]
MVVRIVISNSPCNVDSPSVSRYHLLEKCHRSKLGIAAKANFTSLASCLRFGIEKRGLALNYSPPEAWEESKEDLQYTCEVFKCAETDGGLSLVNDTRYDYYSLYGKPLPHVNSTCVPATGMFFLVTKKLNYTLAFRECKNITAVPADITSEQRTDALAQLLAGASVDAAFVGLRSKNGSTFVTSNGNGLDCITYRAWAPGHPRRYRNKFDCVVITRHRTWLSTSCKKSYPVLCELIPGGPYKRGSIFISRNQKNNGKSQFTEEELQDYEDLTYFTKKEVLYAHQKFKALAPEKVGHNKNAKLPMAKILQYPELRVNPFRDRICKVFSSSNDGDCTFEDFLDMMSVFSEMAPKAVKAEHAFRIFDFDGDDMIGVSDLREVIERLCGPELKLSDSEIQQLVQNVLEEADLDDDGALSFAEFEHIIDKSSDFCHAFRIRL